MRHDVDLQLRPRRSTAQLLRAAYPDIGWTKRDMTLIIAVRAKTGEIIVASDRRTVVTLLDNNNDDDDAAADASVFVLDNATEKLIDFDGAIIGISGRCGAALRIVREFIGANKRNTKSCEALGRDLQRTYIDSYGPDNKAWPRVEVTYCDWHEDRGRILRLGSNDKFMPEEADITPHFSGRPHTALPAFIIFQIGSRSIAHIERYCILSLALTAQLDHSVGADFDMWLLSRAGIAKRSNDAIQAILQSVNESLKGVRQMMYPTEDTA